MELKDMDVRTLKLLAQHTKAGLDQLVAEILRRRPDVTEQWVFTPVGQDSFAGINHGATERAVDS